MSRIQRAESEIIADKIQSISNPALLAYDSASFSADNSAVFNCMLQPL